MSNYDQRDQKIDAQYNADQIIQNIVMVGRFLDFSKVEGLIPDSSASPTFDTIKDAFESTFSKKLGNDLTQATAFAGEILRDMLTSYLPQQPLYALPIRKILEECPTIIGKKLHQYGYWKVFCEPANGGQSWYEVLWLKSTKLLWKKYFDADRLLGIGRPGHYMSSKEDATYFETNFGEAYFIELRHPKKPDDRYSKDEVNGVYINLVTNQEFRILMAGLTVDLIRISSIASDDINFWKEVIDLLTSDNNK